MIAVGLAISAYGAGRGSGKAVALYIGHGVFIGLLGNAGLNAPLYVYVSRWFDRRRGSALALIASGQYIAGALWPPIFERLDRGLWLAADDADVRPVSGRDHPAAGARVSETSARSDAAAGRRGRRRREADGARLAAQSRVRHADGRGLLLLRADVDAAEPSRRALHRSRHLCRRTAPRCCPCCSARRSSAARCGAGSRTGSAG